jgi:SWI/SNF-related matrix-associated actin-dependent regulator of chromatin subfamily A member 5
LVKGLAAGGFYIKCPPCCEAVDQDEERKEWLEGLEQTYNEQHEAWVTTQEEQERLIEKEQDAIRKNKESAKGNTELPRMNGNDLGHGRYIPLDDNEIDSPPALTETSLPTPAPGDSGVITPKWTSDQKSMLVTNGHANSTGSKGKKRIVVDPDDHFGESREEKRARLDNQAWRMDDDPLLNGYKSTRF